MLPHISAIGDWCSAGCLKEPPKLTVLYSEDFTQDIDNFDYSKVIWDGSENYLPVADIDDSVPLNGLELLQKFDSEKDFPDDSGNGNIGACSNCPTFTSKGKLNGAYDFDGVDDAVIITENTNLDGFNAVSLFVWFKQEGGISYQRIYDSFGVSTHGIKMTIQGNGEPNLNLHYRISNENDDEFDFTKYSVAVQNNEWHHLGFTYDGSTFIGYLDGSPFLTKAMSGKLKDYEGSPSIGSGRTPSWKFNGLIDHLSIHSRALTQEEINQLISNTRKITNSYFVSEDIPSSDIKEIKADWVETEGGMKVEVSTDSGLTWTEVMNGGSVYIDGDKVRYKVTFTDVTTLDSLILTRIDRPPGEIKPCKFRVTEIKNEIITKGKTLPYDFCAQSDTSEIMMKIERNNVLVVFDGLFDFSILPDGSFVNIDGGFIVKENGIEIKSEEFGGVDLSDRSAKVTIEEVGTFIEPVILRDGVECTDCNIESYSDGVIVFSVEGWSEYAIIEGYTSPSETGEEQSNADGKTGKPYYVIIAIIIFVFFLVIIHFIRKLKTSGS